jgi:predicted nucleic acid-binding protein
LAISFCLKFFKALAMSLPRRVSSAACAASRSCLSSTPISPRGARNYRRLRDMGITIRKTNDIIIGTFCIERGCSLLHDDRDFVAMEAHLGLVAA